MSMLLRGGTLPNGAQQDLLIEGEVITHIGAGPVPPDTAIHDVAGCLVAPAFVDGHIHLDKTLLGMDWVPHRPGDTVAARIAQEKLVRRDAIPVRERARALADSLGALGTIAVRSHVDIDTGIGLTGLHALLELREACAGRLDIQIVAFPQSGILADPGTADLLAAAMREGADLVGGLDPASIDADIEGHLDIVFGLAVRHAVGVDIHLHDPGALGAYQLRRIAEHTRRSGLSGQVTVSHAFALGAIDDETFGPTAAALAAADIAIMTTGPGPVPMPPIRRLRAAGVRVFAGSDNIRDAWSPFGSGDMLERAMLIAYRSGFLTDEDLELAFHLVTTAPAMVMRRKTAIEVGSVADLVVLVAPRVAQAVVGGAPRRLVLKAGRRIGPTPAALSG